MNETIEIVDRGRGPQLSTSRITVQDLVPYFQQNCSYEEIMRWLPTLTDKEVAVVEQYYRAHQEELDEEDRRIRAHTEEQIRLQRLRIPVFEGTDQERFARLKWLLEQYKQRKNGEGHPG